MDIIEYFETAIKSFEKHPPETPYQKGYLAAMTEALAVAKGR